MQLKTRLLEVSKDLVASGGGGKAGELLPVVGAPPGLFVNEHHEVRQASGPMKRDIMRPVPYAFPRKQVSNHFDHEFAPANCSYISSSFLFVVHTFWRQQHGVPFRFNTEASVRAADLFLKAFLVA